MKHSNTFSLIQKLLYGILLFTILALLCYWLQPIKKGIGYDKSIHYEEVVNWPDLPKGFALGNPTGIGIDTDQHIIVFHRAGREWPLLGAIPKEKIHNNTILIIDKESGKLLGSWGSDLFVMPHGLTVDRNNNVWVTDVGLHQVFKFSHDGKLLLQLGEAGVAGDDSLHFNKPTDVAISKDGSFYVSDGYGNSRVVKFSAEGKYLFSWGKKGSGEGEFNIPHALSLDTSGNVYVADRENNKVQVFDANGRVIKKYSARSFGAICTVAFDTLHNKLFSADDFSFLKLKHRGSDIIVIDSAGNVQTRFGRSGEYNGAATWYHDLVIDRDGNVYVGDILGNRVQKFKLLEK